MKIHTIVENDIERLSTSSKGRLLWHIRSPPIHVHYMGQGAFSNSRPTYQIRSRLRPG
jgi:hypothetical protein